MSTKPFVTTRSNLTEIYVHGGYEETYVTGIMVEFHQGYRFMLVDSEIYHTQQDKHGYVNKYSTDEVLKRLDNKIKQIQKHLDNGGKLNHLLWDSLDPCYGSDAYGKGRDTAMKVLKDYFF